MNLSTISRRDLETLASALEDGRVALPLTELALGRIGLSMPAATTAMLAPFASCGFTAAQAAMLLRAALVERRRAEAETPRIDAVFTGPDPTGTGRDTGLLVNDLFTEAREEVLVSGFALYQGDVVLRTLAQRYDREPDLRVTLCLDVSRRAGDTTRDSDLLLRFARAFRQDHWLGQRLPPIHFDPRGLDPDHRSRAVLHAKCIVIDRRKALVTSANLTLAAQRKNIELGVVIDGGNVPGLIASHFDALVATGHLHRLSS